MTRIFVQRGSSSSSSSSSRSQPSTTSLVSNEAIAEDLQEQAVVGQLVQCSNDDVSFSTDHNDTSTEDTADISEGLRDLRISEKKAVERVELSEDTLQNVSRVSHPPPPPVPPPKPSNARRSVSATSTASRIGPSRRPVAWPVRTSPTDSRPSSPRSHGESDGYNSADEQNPCFVSSYGDVEREQQFEIDIRRAKGLEVKKMLEDGNCLFRAVADQVYGDSEVYDSIRQMCIDYMERERDHFSQFITEFFTSYCKRKRRDKVYGNNVEIQALSEMYNRPIHIYSYSTEPINTFHGSYNTDNPPIRLSYHHGNHYNSLVDPRRLTIGAGLGFSCLRGVHTNLDKDKIKAAITAQQDQQIDNALIAEGRFYSDLELTEKEMERMVMEISRAEYIADDSLKQHIQSSTSNAEPSSSGARSLTRDGNLEEEAVVKSSSMKMVLAMGFGYLQAMEAFSLFGDDVDSMLCYLLESTPTPTTLKGKAAELNQ